MKASGTEILDNGEILRIQWEDGSDARFHAVWLRDNALDATTRSPSNGQRLVSLLDIPKALRLLSAGVTSGGDIALAFAPGGHETVFPAGWLWGRRYDRRVETSPGWTAPEATPWDGGLRQTLPTATWPDIASGSAALGVWLSAVRRFGFALLTGLPRTSGSLIAVAERFGFVRETNYGRWFDVKAEVDPNNLAYTNLGLQAHTDNPYRDPVPTLQLLACLENSVEGGESLVVDGFAVARRLREENPAGFALLAAHPARFAYAGQDGVKLEAKRPIVELGPDGELLAVRFNNRSAAPFVDVPFDAMPAFYAAYRRFAEILEDPAMAVTFRLAPGDLFIVDNTRVLHARRAFSSSGSRWLQGCYADKDGLLSTLAAIESKRRDAE